MRETRLHPDSLGARKLREAEQRLAALVKHTIYELRLDGIAIARYSTREDAETGIENEVYYGGVRKDYTIVEIKPECVN